MATYTADGAQGGLVRAMHSGDTTMISRYNAAGATISTGDVYVMARVPNGSTIYDIRTWGRGSGVGGIVFDVGYISSALTTLSAFAQATISATDLFVVRTPAALPFTVNLSDDAVNQFVTITLAAASGTATATGTFGVVVKWTGPGSGRP